MEMGMFIVCLVPEPLPEVIKQFSFLPYSYGCGLSHVLHITEDSFQGNLLFLHLSAPNSLGVQMSSKSISILADIPESFICSYWVLLACNIRIVGVNVKTSLEKLMVVEPQLNSAYTTCVIMS
jgi:hypothetical protein